MKRELRTIGRFQAKVEVTFPIKLELWNELKRDGIYRDGLRHSRKFKTLLEATYIDLNSIFCLLRDHALADHLIFDCICITNWRVVGMFTQNDSSFMLTIRI